MIYFTAKHDLISSKDSYLFMKFVCALPAPVGLFLHYIRQKIRQKS